MHCTIATQEKSRNKWCETVDTSQFQAMKAVQYEKIIIKELTFFRLGKLGRPFSVVRPTLMRLNDSKFLKSAVKPSINVALQLSRLSSLICNTKVCVSSRAKFCQLTKGKKKMKQYFLLHSWTLDAYPFRKNRAKRKGRRKFRIPQEPLC